jgi:hypothetical protein
MALSFDDKKQVRKALIEGLGRAPSTHEYRQALIQHPNTRQYQDLDNLDSDTAEIDNEIKQESNRALADNEAFLGLNKTPDNFVMQDSGAASAMQSLGLPEAALQPQVKKEVLPETSAPQLKETLQAATAPDMPAASHATPPQHAAPSMGDEEFDKAQSQFEQNKKDAMLSDIASKIGTALANQHATIGSGIKDSMADINKQAMEQAASPLEALKAKREQYKKLVENRTLAKSQDATSAESVAARELYRSMGGKADDSATASDLDQSLKYLQQKYSVDEAKRARLMQYQLMAEAKKEALNNKLSTKDATELDKYTNVITGNSRGAEQFKNLNARMNGVGQAMALINAHKKDGRSFIRPAEMTELNMELARILTGSGVVHESTMRHIDPTSGPRAFAEMMEKATGQPYNINNIDSQIDRLSHNLSNQYTQAEKQLTNMGTTIARGNEHKVNTLTNYLKDQRAINGVGDLHSPTKTEGSKGKVSNSTLQDYANKHKISVDSAKELLTKSGYVVE